MALLENVCIFGANVPLAPDGMGFICHVDYFRTTEQRPSSRWLCSDAAAFLTGRWL
jgi:hypothetical protein